MTSAAPSPTCTARIRIHGRARGSSSGAPSALPAGALPSRCVRPRDKAKTGVHMAQGLHKHLAARLVGGQLFHGKEWRRLRQQVGGRLLLRRAPCLSHSPSAPHSSALARRSVCLLCACLTLAWRAGCRWASAGARPGYRAHGLHAGADARAADRDAEDVAEGSGEARGGGRLQLADVCKPAPPSSEGRLLLQSLASDESVVRRATRTAPRAAPLKATVPPGCAATARRTCRSAP